MRTFACIVFLTFVLARTALANDGPDLESSNAQNTDELASSFFNQIASQRRFTKPDDAQLLVRAAVLAARFGNPQLASQLLDNATVAKTVRNDFERKLALVLPQMGADRNNNGGERADPLGESYRLRGLAAEAAKKGDWESCQQLFHESAKLMATNCFSPAGIPTVYIFDAFELLQWNGVAPPEYTIGLHMGLNADGKTSANRLKDARGFGRLLLLLGKFDGHLQSGDTALAIQTMRELQEESLYKEVGGQCWLFWHSSAQQDLRCSVGSIINEIATKHGDPVVSQACLNLLTSLNESADALSPDTMSQLHLSLAIVYSELGSQQQSHEHFHESWRAISPMCEDDKRRWEFKVACEKVNRGELNPVLESLTRFRTTKREQSAEWARALTRQIMATSATQGVSYDAALKQVNPASEGEEVWATLGYLEGLGSGSERVTERPSTASTEVVEPLRHSDLTQWAAEGDWHLQDGVLRSSPVQNEWGDSRVGYKQPLPRHGMITFEWRRTRTATSRTGADPGLSLQTSHALPGQEGRHPGIEYVFADIRLCVVNALEPAAASRGSISMSVAPAIDLSKEGDAWNTSRLAYADNIIEMWLNDKVVYRIDAREELRRAPTSEPVEQEAVDKVLGKWIDRSDTSLRLLLVCLSPKDRFEGVEMRNLRIAPLEPNDLADAGRIESDKIDSEGPVLISHHPVYTALRLEGKAAESLRISLLPPRPFASLIDLPNPGATSDPSLIRNYSREFWEGAVEASQLNSMFLATYQLNANNARVPESVPSRSLPKVWVFAWELKTDGHAAALHAHLSKNYVDDSSAAWAVGRYVIYMTGGDEAPASRRQVEEYLRQQSSVGNGQ